MIKSQDSCGADCFFVFGADCTAGKTTRCSPSRATALTRVRLRGSMEQRNTRRKLTQKSHHNTAGCFVLCCTVGCASCCRSACNTGCASALGTENNANTHWKFPMKACLGTENQRTPEDGVCKASRKGTPRKQSGRRKRGERRQGGGQEERCEDVEHLKRARVFHDVN